MIDPNAIVLGVALFGSRARGDFYDKSDVDVLLWTTGKFPSVQTNGILSLSFYPHADLLKKAADGDLFVSHVVHEAVPIWDPRDLLSELREAFTPKKSFDKIISDAAELGSLLIHRADTIKPRLLNRRIAWVVRTILIARAAERGQYLFSANALATFLDVHEAEVLIAARDELLKDDCRLAAFARILQRWGNDRYLAAPSESYYQLFSKSANELGLRTLREIRAADETSDYF